MVKISNSFVLFIILSFQYIGKFPVASEQNILFNCFYNHNNEALIITPTHVCLLVCLFVYIVYISNCPGTLYVDQDNTELTESPLLLPPDFWD